MGLDEDQKNDAHKAFSMCTRNALSISDPPSGPSSVPTPPVISCGGLRPARYQV